MHVPAPEGALRIRISTMYWLARRHTTRLETRTKESIHMCEYAGAKPVCGMKVSDGT